MTKPKNDYPGRKPRHRPTRAAAAQLPSRLIDTLTRTPNRCVAELAIELGFSKNTVRDRLLSLEIDGRTICVRVPGATSFARPLELWSLRTNVIKLNVDPLIAALFCPARREAA